MLKCFFEESHEVWYSILEERMYGGYVLIEAGDIFTDIVVRLKRKGKFGLD